MRQKTASSLADALLAGTRIREALDGLPLQSYAADWEKQAAVHYLFLTLGEALTRVRDAEPSVFAQIPDAAQIVGFRHLLAHGYDALEPDRVYENAKERLPGLLATLEDLVEVARREGH